jgi:hypothetical protein
LYIFGVKAADKQDETFLLTPSFCGPRSQKRKNADDLTQFFQLLGSEQAKSAFKTLMKLAPDCR